MAPTFGRRNWCSGSRRNRTRRQKPISQRLCPAEEEFWASRRQLFPNLIVKNSPPLGPITQLTRNAAFGFHRMPMRSRIPERKGRDSFIVAKDDIQLLYEYDRWANNRVLHAVSVLSAEQFTRDLGGSFRSVRDTLLHIIGGEWGWLAYWKAPLHGPAFLKDLKSRRDSLFNPEAFPDVSAVRLKWTEIEREQTEFVDCLTDEVLRK